MALVLDDDETMLADAVRGLLDKVAPVSAFRAMRDAKTEKRFDPALLRQLAENGFIAPNVAECDGGVGLGAAAAGVIAEQAGHTLAAAPLLGAAMAASLLNSAGSDELRQTWLPRIVSGEAIVAAAFDESSRHDPDALQTTARLCATGWRVDGTKTAVIDGFMADALIVSARTDQGIALFLVEAGAAGMAEHRIDAFDTRNMAGVCFEETPAQPLESDDPVSAIGAANDLGRALLAAELLGIADEAFARTISYLQEREQFDRKIGAFQGLQHRVARLYARLDLGRGTVLKALRAIDAGSEDATLLASLAKAVMTRLARDMLGEAVQMHGGIGVTDAFDIGLFFKRARTAGELLGDDAFHAERLAQMKWGL